MICCWDGLLIKGWRRLLLGISHKEEDKETSSSRPLAGSSDLKQAGLQEQEQETSRPASLPAAGHQLRKDLWGLWEEHEASGDRARSNTRYCVRLCIAGEEVCSSFASKSEAWEFQRSSLRGSTLAWPRRPEELEGDGPVERDPLWDHPEELEEFKEYTFRVPPAVRATSSTDGAEGNDNNTNNSNSKQSKSGKTNNNNNNKKKKKASAETVRNSSAPGLSLAEAQQFEEQGFLLGLEVLAGEELTKAKADFEDLLADRLQRCQTEEDRFRATHTLARPLHQDLVARLAQNERVLSIVEDILGPRFVCWSAHLFCKLPGDPTQQPWHQDAGFWPLSASRALTVWVAIDDVDSTNSSVRFVPGSHRLGRLPWRRTTAEHKLLTQEIPDVDLLGDPVSSVLKAGQASVHCDLTVHGSAGNSSTRRRAGVALRFVGSDAECLGPMINGYRMNNGCILPRGTASDPKQHWKALKRRSGGEAARMKRQLAAVAGATPGTSPTSEATA